MYTKDGLLTEIKGDLLSIDTDHTKAARKFYARYWKDTLSGDILDYDGAYGHYRGETILSFNTIAGCAMRLTDVYRNGLKLPDSSEERLAIIESQKDIPDSIAKQFAKYHKKYHTLANFMPLVVGREHMNLIKGGYTYHDMPDLFFEQVKIYYEIGSNDREIFFDKTNVEYFKRFKDWKGYVEGNYLQDFFINESCTAYNPDEPYSEFLPLICEIYPGKIPNTPLPYSGANVKHLTNQERHNCLDQIDTFLSIAIGIIENRAERLIREAEAEEERKMDELEKDPEFMAQIENIKKM